MQRRQRVLGMTLEAVLTVRSGERVRPRRARWQFLQARWPSPWVHPRQARRLRELWGLWGSFPQARRLWQQVQARQVQAQLVRRQQELRG